MSGAPERAERAGQASGRYRTRPRVLGAVFRYPLKRFLPYLAGLAIVALLLWQIDPLEVLRLLAGAEGRWLLVGLGAYVLTNVLRAYRFGVLLNLEQGPGKWDERPGAQQEHNDAPSPAGHTPPAPRVTLSPLRILPEMFALSLFNNTLPSRSGELSFPYFMRSRHGMAVSESTAALLIVRVFDYLAVALLYVAFALLNLAELAPAAAAVVLVVAGLLLLSVLMLAALPWLGRQLLRLAQWLMQRLRLERTRGGRTLLDLGARVVVAFEHMRTSRRYALTFGWSLLVWLATFAWFAAFMEAIGLGTPYPLVIVGATFAMLAKALPFITIGGFGAHEAGWAVGFGLVGMESGLAISSGFAVNILTLLASLICGGLALLTMRLGHKADVAGSAAAHRPAQAIDPSRIGEPFSKRRLDR